MLKKNDGKESARINEKGKSMKKKPTITIGIPAYNEEVSIGNLIKSLLAQKENSFELKKIIVSSDGSTDETAKIVREFKSNKILLLDNKKRRGQSYGQNQIIKLCDSDILILLNADIVLKDLLFLYKITYPIIKKNSDLVSCDLEPIEPITSIEKVLYISTKIKNSIYKSYKNSLNIYTCHGSARAFSKRLYSKLNFKNIVAEDAYSYLFCILNNFKYSYTTKTKVLFKLSHNLVDHEKQSVRFFKSKKSS